MHERTNIACPVDLGFAAVAFAVTRDTFGPRPVWHVEFSFAARGRAYHGVADAESCDLFSAPVKGGRARRLPENHKRDYRAAIHEQARRLIRKAKQERAAAIDAQADTAQPAPMAPAQPDNSFAACCEYAAAIPHVAIADKLAIAALVHAAISHDYACNVNNGGEDDELEAPASDAATIIAAMGAADEDHLSLWADGKRKVAFFLVYGNGASDETIADYSANPACEMVADTAQRMIESALADRLDEKPPFVAAAQPAPTMAECIAALIAWVDQTTPANNASEQALIDQSSALIARFDATQA